MESALFLLYIRLTKNDNYSNYLFWNSLKKISCNISNTTVRKNPPWINFVTLTFLKKAYPESIIFPFFSRRLFP